MGILDRLFSKEPENLPEPIRRQKSIKDEIDLWQSIEKTDFVVFDTELTGLDYKKDSLIAIGAIKMRGSRIYPGKTFYSLIKPASTLKCESVVVHEITHTDLCEAKEPEEAIVEFVDFIGPSVLVGHFVHIDLHFINLALKKYFHTTLKNPAIDTLNLHEWLYENESTFKKHFKGTTTSKDLYSIAKKYGINTKKSHNALYDAFLTAQLLQRFLHFLSLSGVKTIKELLMIARV